MTGRDQDKAERLAAALRENLLRRKGRARAVAADAPPAAADDAPCAGGPETERS